MKTVLNSECPSQNIIFHRHYPWIHTYFSVSFRQRFCTLGKPAHLGSQILSTLWPPLSELFTTETSTRARHNRIFYHFCLVVPSTCSKAYGPHITAFVSAASLQKVQRVGSERIRILENNKNPEKPSELVSPCDHSSPDHCKLHPHPMRETGQENKSPHHNFS